VYNYDSNVFMSNLYEGVYIVDKSRKIIFWNSGSEQITGYKADEVVDSHCYHDILKHVDVSGKRLCQDGCPLQNTLETGSTNENNVFLEHKLGYRIPVTVKTLPLYDDNRNIVAAVEVFTDSKFKETQYQENQKLKKLIQIDELTKIYNRKYLEFKLNQSISEAKEFNDTFGLLFIDIDHFKLVNDNYGHNVGDGVLKVISNTIKSNLRPNDVVGRWGGEEFIAIIKTNNLLQLEETAERIRQLCENSTYNHKSKNICVSVSIGGSLYKKNETIKDLINRSDKFMYDAKQAGRNKCIIR
jgi:two-component system cell cycle response regulator